MQRELGAIQRGDIMLSCIGEKAASATCAIELHTSRRRHLGRPRCAERAFTNVPRDRSSFCLKQNPWRHVLEQETWTVMPTTPADHRPTYFFPVVGAWV